MENVNELTQEAASAAEEMSSATEQLSGMAQELQKLVAQFKVAAAMGDRRPRRRPDENRVGLAGDTVEHGRAERRTEMAKRVLVVDDANFMRMIVKDTLTPNGFEIAGEATNGAEAVTKYAELKPDLVTMDITMKVKDGLEAAREILAADPNARIVMVTALGQEKMLLDSIAAGGEGLRREAVHQGADHVRRAEGAAVGRGRNHDKDQREARQPVRRGRHAGGHPDRRHRGAARPPLVQEQGGALLRSLDHHRDLRVPHGAGRLQPGRDARGAPGGQDARRASRRRRRRSCSWTAWARWPT